VIVLNIPIPLSNNNTGQSRHWSAANKSKQTFAKVLSTLNYRATPPPYKQRVTITRVLGRGERLWDADSVLRGSAKQLLDSLVDAGFFHDDGPKWITEVSGKQDDSQRSKGPSIRVEIEAV
jgi:hypothetical protein